MSLSNSPDIAPGASRGKIIALADCNNFFVSCERLFRPDLKNRPVVVLSNNDGCVISRSNEAKALGIKMGVPFFQIADLARRYRIAAFSSNFPLYLDISRRVTSTLEEFCPRLENYSVDESFLDLSGLDRLYDIPAYCLKIRETVTRNTGIPICVGAAATKTLAKAANHAAKKNFIPGGAAVILDEVTRRRVLKWTPVGDIWGVGSRLEPKIREILHAGDAWEFAECDEYRLRHNFNKTVYGTWKELNGESFFELEDQPRPKKQMMWSRTFGNRIADFGLLRETMAGFAVSIMQKLREEHQYAGTMGIFISSSPFDPRPCSDSATLDLGHPVNDTVTALNGLDLLLEKIFRPGVPYARGGIILCDLSLTPEFQTDLFDPVKQPGPDDEKRKKLMATIDLINSRGRNTIFFAAQGRAGTAKVSRQTRLSPAYTTSWKDVPKVR